MHLEKNILWNMKIKEYSGIKCFNFLKNPLFILN